MGKPGFYFYTGDYLKDTRCLTAEARGCYMDWLCMLHDRGGTAEWPVSAFAQFSGVSNETALHVLNQLELTHVADVEWQNDSKTIAKLSNRRMVRDVRDAEDRERLSAVRSYAGRQGAKKRWQKWHSSSSSSTSLNLNKDTTYLTASPDGFAEFWSLYPRKKNKGDAEKAWKTLKPNDDLLAKILDAVRRGRATPDWQKEDGQFIPYPGRWLRAKGWEDEVPEPRLLTPPWEKYGPKNIR